MQKSLKNVWKEEQINYDYLKDKIFDESCRKRIVDRNKIMNLMNSSQKFATRTLDKS